MPEVPKDTPETNALLRDDHIPAYNELDIKKVQNGFQKTAIEYDNNLNNILDELIAGKLFYLFLIYCSNKKLLKLKKKK